MMIRPCATAITATLLLMVCSVSACADEALDALRKLAVDEHGRALAALRTEADAALGAKLLRITDKTAVAPSGDPRDYFDLSPYHWPNPNSADGLPYVFRDGQLNPEAAGDQYSRVNYFAMGDQAKTLALAYRLTGHESYAERAALVVRSWFLDAEYGMRPNLNYSQHIRGIPGGQPIGIIRGMTIVELVDATRWLEASQHWTSADRTAWSAWLTAYCDWLQTSDPGRKESQARNNHGTWYDVQVATLALVTGQQDLALRVVAVVPAGRFKNQLRPDGGQPFELLRTKSWDYSVMNLEAMFRLARLGDAVGVDLWSWHDDAGRSLRGALDFLVPAATGERPWSTKQIRDFEPAKLYPLLRRAATAYHEPAYDTAAGKIPEFDPAARREALWALVGVP